MSSYEAATFKQNFHPFGDPESCCSWNLLCKCFQNPNFAKGLGAASLRELLFPLRQENNLLGQLQNF